MFRNCRQIGSSALSLFLLCACPNRFDIVNGGTGTPLPVGCGDSRLNGLEPCDGAVLQQGADCSAYGLGAGSVTCTFDCKISFAACATQDLCTANGWYNDGKCDDCVTLGGATADPDCATLCTQQGTCADVYDSIANTWSCQAATGAADPDCGQCGNGIVEGNEFCDGAALASGADDCTAFDFLDGTLACRGDCVPDFANCLDQVCGNYIVEAKETCDGTNVLGRTCRTEGFGDGTLACTRSCTLDTRACGATASVSLDGVITALCSWLSRCESVLGRTFESSSACHDAYSYVICEVGESTASQSEADACAAAITTMGCDANSAQEGPGAVCDTTFGDASEPGLGERCEYDCNGDLYCKESSTPGVCSVCTEPASANQACGFVGDNYVPCDDLSFCNADTHMCETRKANGAGCGDHDEECQSEFCRAGTCSDPLGVGTTCYPGDQCAGEFRRCIDGRCGDRRLPGDSCSSDSDCVTLASCEGLVCTRYPMPTCTAREPEPPGKIGQPCSGEACVLGAHCDFRPDPSLCAADTPLGQPCTDWDECGPQAYCNGFPNGTCKAYAGVGGSCDYGSGGASCIGDTWCDDATEVCNAPQANGATCTAGEQCESGYCHAPAGECADPSACVMP